MTREASNLKGIPFPFPGHDFAICRRGCRASIHVHVVGRKVEFSEISLIFSVASTTFLVFPFLWGMIADRYLPIEWMFFFLNGMAGVSMWWMQSQTEYGGLMLSFVFFYSFYHPTFTLINALSFQYLTRPR